MKKYTNCTFDDGLEFRDKTKLFDVQARAVETEEGLREVTRIESWYVLARYPKKEPFATIRPERSQLVDRLFKDDKQFVFESLAKFSQNSREVEKDEVSDTTLNGFRILKLDRKTITGSTLAINVLFHDIDFSITTIYFFNAKPDKRSFQTIEEWRVLRDRFLKSYTKCINKNMGR